MRTTVTLDPDVEAKLKAAMRQRGISFKVAINDAVRVCINQAIHRSLRMADLFRQRLLTV